MAQHDHAFGTGGAHFLDHRGHVFIADAKGVFRKHPAWVGDGHIGEGLADDGNLGASAFEHFVGREQLCRFVPFSVEYILPKGRERQLLDQFRHAVRAQRKLPVECHRLWRKGVHDIHHVLPGGLVACVRAVPRVATVQQNCVWPVRTDRFDYGRDPVQSTDPAIPLRQCRKIIRAQRIVRGRSIFDAIEPSEIGTRDMRNRSFVFSNPDVDRRFAKVDWLQLGVNIGDVDQRNVSVCLEFQQAIL